MITFLRTDSSNKDFIQLVKQLDVYLAEVDGDEHSFYNQFNKINLIKYAIVAYEKNIAVACGAIKEFATDTMEIKRMFTLPQHRGKGLAKQILHELEQWTRELSYKKLVLETGKRQRDAIELYLKTGYKITANYGQYIGVANSICFEKQL